MAEAPYLMGIDLGTGGVRVGLFDRQGSPVVFRAEEWETRHPHPGWAEQDPGEWWTGLVRATRGALEESGVPAAEVAGISVDASASTVVAADADGRHLRPAIMWMDVRAADQARRIQETGDAALKYNGFGAVSAELGLPKALWLKENEPETWDGADWVIQRLTGEATTSINTASGKYYYDRSEGGFPASLYVAAGIEDLLDKTPQQVLDLGVAVGGAGQGRRRRARARGRHTGGRGRDRRPRGGPRARGGVPEHAGPDHRLLARHHRAGRRRHPRPRLLGCLHRRHHPRPVHGRGRPGVHRLGGGLVQEHLRRRRGRRGRPARRRPYVVLNELAAEVPIGSEGLLVLDYVLRSIVAAGGATRSELWMQLHADVSDVPSRSPGRPRAGIHPDIPTAAAELVHVERTIDPDPGRHQQYAFFLARYTELYPQVKDVLQQMSRHIGGHGQP